MTQTFHKKYHQPKSNLSFPKVLQTWISIEFKVDSLNLPFKQWLVPPIRIHFLIRLLFWNLKHDNYYCSICNKKNNTLPILLNLDIKLGVAYRNRTNWTKIEYSNCNFLILSSILKEETFLDLFPQTLTTTTCNLTAKMLIIICVHLEIP